MQSILSQKSLFVFTVTASIFLSHLVFARAEASNSYSVDLERDSQQYFSVSDNDALSVESDLTLEVWVKFESVPSGVSSLVSKISPSGDNGYFLYYQQIDGKLRLWVDTGSDEADEGVSWVPTIGQWHHLTVTYNEITGETAFLVDGAPIGITLTFPTGGPANGNDPLFIGADYNAMRTFDGLIDEVRIWNVARTAEEIAANMNKELVGDEAGLVAYWKLNNSLEDATANGNNLTAVNNPQFSTDTPFTDAEETIDPVIVVPGILGSAQRHDVWIIDPILHTYDDLIATLDENGYTLGEDLFTFGYDWRNSNVATAALLKQKIDEVKGICACSKVDLVAHSMGGLVARQYVQSGDYEDDVDQLVFLGTPHRGAPKAYLMWEGGEFVSPSVSDGLTKRFLKGEARKNGYASTFAYIREHPITTLSELLPDYSYLSKNGGLQTYPIGYPVNTFLETLNSALPALFSSGIDINAFVSTNKDTITAIRVEDAPEKAPLWEHGYPEDFEEAGDRGLDLGSGDGTVPAVSATFISATTTTLASSHNALPEDAAGEIVTLLSGAINPIVVDDWNLPDIKILLFQLFSPADIMITDPEGKRVGMNGNTEINEISGAFYAGSNALLEYVTIPNPILGTYTVSVRGTGTGSYEVIASYLAEGKSDDLSRVGGTAPNALTNHTIVLDENGGGELQVEVTIERMLEDLAFVYREEWISKGVYTSISAKLKAASQMRDAISRSAILHNIKKEIERAYGKGINDRAYELLKEDIDALLN